MQSKISDPPGNVQPKTHRRSAQNFAFVDAALSAINASSDFYVTPAVVMVLEVFADADQSLNPQDVSAALVERGVQVHIVTIRRMLVKLQDLRIISPVGVLRRGYVRREDCGGKARLPVVFVDAFNQKIKVLDAPKELRVIMTQIIHTYGLPDTDYCVQLVAGTSFVEGGTE